MTSSEISLQGPEDPDDSVLDDRGAMTLFFGSKRNLLLVLCLESLLTLAHVSMSSWPKPVFAN